MYPILYPRTYEFRILQQSNGEDLSQLRMENRGLAPINWMHHISKIIEGKTESYRVRVCRTCTKLAVPLELGSYADVESALLINDAYEILQGRTKQLHLLVPNDIHYLKYLSVRKRGGLQDVPLLFALEERTKKSFLKSKNGGDADEVVPAVVTEGTTSTNGAATFSTPLARHGDSGMAVDEEEGFRQFEPQVSLMENVIPRGHLLPGQTTFSFPVNSTTPFFGYQLPPRSAIPPTPAPQNPLDFLSEVAGYHNSQSWAQSTHSASAPMEFTAYSNGGNSTNMFQPGNSSKPQESKSSKKKYVSYSDQAQSFVNSRVYQQSIRGNTAAGAQIPSSVAFSNMVKSSSSKSSSDSGDHPSARGSNDSSTAAPGDGSPTSLPIKKRIRGYDLMFSNHEKASCDSHSITEILKTSIKPYSQHLRMWHYFDDDRSADVMLDHLINFLSTEVLNPRHVSHDIRKHRQPSSSSRPLLAPLPSSLGDQKDVAGIPLMDVEGSRSLLFKTIQSSYCLPSAEILKIISSVCPTDNEDTQAMISTLSSILPHDSPSISDYTSTYHIASSVLKSFADVSFANSTAEDADTLRQKLDKKLELVDVFIRYMHTVAAQFDYILRLTIWNSLDIEILDAEIKVNGIFNQLSLYLGVAVQFIKELLRVIDSLQASSPTHSSKSASTTSDLHSMKEDDESEESAPEEISTAPRSIEEFHAYLHKKLVSSSQHAVNGLSMMMTTFCTSSLAVKSICSDDRAIYRCVVLCQECYPILCLHIRDINILISYTFQFAHIISSLLFTLTEDQTGPVFVDHLNDTLHIDGTTGSKADEAVKFKKLAFSLGGELVGLIQKYFKAFPNGKSDGMKSLFYHEIGLCAHISIFQLSITLIEQNFLSSFGYTMTDLLDKINGIMISIMDICEEYTCSTTSTHLLVAVYKLAKSCLFNGDRYDCCFHLKYSFTIDLQ